MTVPRIVRLGLSVVALTVAPNLVAAEPGADLRYSSEADGHFAGEDLAAVKLSYSVLSDANFSNADLSRASLNYCVASDAWFNGATCTETSFAYAVLASASFEGADCRGADFSYSILTDTNFSGTDLRGAQFQSALLGGRFDANTLYDEATQFPPGFDPQERGLTFISLKREQKAREGLEAALEMLKLVAARFPETAAGKRAKELVERETDEDQSTNWAQPPRPNFR